MVLKILLSTEGDQRYVDSITIRIIRIAELLKENFDVKTLILLKGVRNQNSVIESIYRNLILSAKQLYHTAKYRPDIIYCSFNFGAVVFFYLYFKIMKTKLIFEIPGILSKEQKDVKTNNLKVGIIKILEKLNTKISDYVIGVGEDVTTFYRQYTNKITTIVNFVDIALFENAGCHREETRNKLGIGRKDKLVGIVGPFTTAYNEYYIQFLRANLIYFDDRIKFLIIGKYENQIINPRVINAGFLKDVDYRDYISAIDILLAPNKYATTGPLTKILEAAASGSATITTPEGFIGLYYFENQKDIVVCEEHEIIQYLNIELFVKDKINQLGRNARDIVKQYYSKEAVQHKLIEVIDSVRSAT